MKRKKKTRRSANKLTTLDDFLKGEGKFKEFEAVTDTDSEKLHKMPALASHAQLGSRI